MALVTIAIPYHHGERWIHAAVESVLAQRDTRWTLVVSDDEGSASLEALLAGFGEARVGYARRVAGTPGMVGNFNHCLDAADTDLVTLLHQDDRLGPDYVGHVLETAAAHPSAAAFFCDARIIDEHDVERRSMADAVKPWLTPRGTGPLVLAGEPGLTSVMAANFIVCPSLCYRRSVLGTRRFDPRWRQVQDLDLTSRLLLDGDVLVGTRRVDYVYRRHDESATSKQSETWLRFDEEFALFDEVAARASARGWETAARVARRKTILKLHLGWAMLRAAGQLEVERAVETARYLARRW
jgi:glycosyltransferase involved in cell wall biosynthesis